MTHAPPPAPHLAHHFNSLEQQRAAAKLGMWIFLLTEVFLFSGLFVVYAVFRAMHPEIFTGASLMLDVRLGGLNTVVLIGSSLTMALAVRSAQLGRARAVAQYLWLTLALAAVFLIVKYFEYEHKIHLGVLPGRYFHPSPDLHLDLSRARIFFSVYYSMTGLHGLHVLAGMSIIFWMIRRVRRGEFADGYTTPIELTGLYWHLVDMIWIYLFPLLYLIR